MSVSQRMRLVVFQPDIAGNLGAMLRSAACFDAAVDVIGPCGFALSDKALRRAALDYAGPQDVRYHVDWAAFRAAGDPGRLVLLSTGAQTSLWQPRFRPEDRLLVGRETGGVPDEVRAAADLAVRIPMPGGGRSLNVGVAAAIALAEVARQRAGADTG
ncbi:MAG: TrmH family RNA methyltransferase [Pseudomonadota bacterium]